MATNADNILTWDREVLVAALVAGLEIDFEKLLLTVIYKRAFNTFPTGKVGIGLIRDEANVAASQ